MTIPENILIFLGITLILSILANAAFVGLLVAYVNSERAHRMEAMKRK